MTIPFLIAQRAATEGFQGFAGGLFSGGRRMNQVRS